MKDETKNRSSDFRPAGDSSELDSRARRLRDAVRRAGGNLKVSKASGVPLSTLQGYLSGTPMKLEPAIALASACEVTVEWLATGQALPATAASRARDAMLVALDQLVGKSLPPHQSAEIAGLAMPQAPLRAPHQAPLDAAALAKAIEIVEALIVPNGGSIASLASARRISNIYQAMTSPDEHLQPLPQLPSPAPEE
jgi:hypothetical protein